jgi:hypothetical protein
MDRSAGLLVGRARLPGTAETLVGGDPWVPMSVNNLVSFIFFFHYFLPYFFFFPILNDFSFFMMFSFMLFHIFLCLPFPSLLFLFSLP